MTKPVKIARKFNAALGAGNAEGSVWDVTIIQSGPAPALPHIYISHDAITRSSTAFEGARVYLLSDPDYFGHKRDSSKKGMRDMIGIIKNTYVQGDELRGELHILPSASRFKEDLLFLKQQNNLDAIQLSVDGGFYSDGTQFVPEWNENVPKVVGLSGGDVDIVPRGAAGGKFNRLVASLTNHNQGALPMTLLKQKMLALFALVYPSVFVASGSSLFEVPENELYTKLLAADKPQSRFQLPDGFNAETTPPIIDSLLQKFQAGKVEPEKKDDPPPASANQNGNDDLKRMQAAMDQQIRQIEILQKIACASQLAVALQESKFPEKTCRVLAAKWAGKIFTEAELAQDIKATREIVADYTNPAVDNLGMDVHVTAESRDKLLAAADLMFATAGTAIKPLRAGTDEYNKIAKVGNGNINPLRSIKELYVAVTGDENVTGLVKHSRFKASIDTTAWSEVLANTLNRQLVRDYAMIKLDNWRNFADVVPLGDFRLQTRVRFGGYGNLPIVAQGAGYLGLSSPTDESATYSPAKRGGTEDLTLEAIKDDDVGFFTKVPVRMARAAKQTLCEFAYDFIRPGVNPTIYDGVALYIAAHANVGTAALDAAGLKAARLRMKKQAQKDNSKRLGINGKIICVPPDLEGTGYELVVPAYGKSNMTPEFLQTLQYTVDVVDYWSDATDWVLVGDRQSGVGLEIGFVDGQEDPELFVSDMPNVGSFFTNDVVTIKIKHTYGGNIIDYRFFDGSVVSG